MDNYQRAIHLLEVNFVSPSGREELVRTLAASSSELELGVIRDALLAVQLVWASLEEVPKRGAYVFSKIDEFLLVSQSAIVPETLTSITLAFQECVQAALYPTDNDEALHGYELTENPDIMRDWGNTIPTPDNIPTDSFETLAR